MSATAPVLSPPADPGALPFLPLLYVAWADGDLTAEEISELRGRISQAPGLAETARAELAAWLDPAAPPPPRALRALLDRVREAAAGLPAERRQSLARLGAGLAGGAAGPETLAALDAVEEALGVVGAEAARGLLAAPVEPDGDASGSSFDPAEMQLVLDGEYRDTRVRVRSVLADPLFRRRFGLSTAEQRELTLERLRALARAGLGALSYPPAYGGEADLGKFAVAFETIATADLSLVIKYGVQFGLFGGAIRMLGTRRHHDRYLRAAATVELPGCFAMTELGHGSNVAGIETEAVYDPSDRTFVIRTPNDAARKEYIGNAALHGRLAVVFAQLVAGGRGRGVHALIAPIRDEQGSPWPGVRIEDCGEKLGLNGVDNGRLWFDSVRVPRENLLDRYAQVTEDGEYLSPIPSDSKRFFTMLGALVAGRVSVALGALSAMKAGLTIAVRYGSRRRQFGPEGGAEVRLLDYLSHQRRLLPHLATAYATDFALKDLLTKFVAAGEESDREVETLAAGLKAYATRANLDALQECRECCGGQGYLAVNRFADLKADTDIYATFEGDNTVLLQLVAKALLADYKRQFEDLRPFTMLKFVAARAADAVGAPSPLQARETASAELRAAKFHLWAFRYRERRLLAAAARRLRARLREGADSFHAFAECQDHLLACASAHVERIVLESFVAAVERCERDDPRTALDTLRALYGLSRLERDRAWFLEAGAFAANKSRAIRREVNTLCAEIRPDAVALVDAFGIPDGLLGAPIAPRGRT